MIILNIPPVINDSDYQLILTIHVLLECSNQSLSDIRWLLTLITTNSMKLFAKSYKYLIYPNIYILTKYQVFHFSLWFKQKKITIFIFTLNISLDKLNIKKK